MKPTMIVGIVIVCVVIAGIGGYLLLNPGVPLGGGAVTLNNPTGTTSNSMTLTWSQNTDTDFVSYSIYQSTSSGTLGSPIATITNKATTSYAVTGLSSNTTYYFTVRVNRAAGAYDSNQVTATTSGGTVGLTSDFQPAWGRPANPMSFPDTERLMIATSDNGLSFTRTDNILADRGSVADAVVLSNGRILVYYVATYVVENGVARQTNETVVAVSDDSGASWAYKRVTFNGVPSGATPPVDPNVVLKPDGTLRLFTTIDPDAGGSQKARTYSFLSTDGGFTYDIEGQRFSVSGQDVLDPETFRFSDTNWKIWAGNRHATSTDGNTFTDQGIVTVATDGGYPVVIADITDFSTATPLYRMYVHSGAPTGGTQIKSLTSTDTTNWTLESGARLTLDTSAGKESAILFFSTVVHLKNGTYLMVYETTIPA